MEQVCAGEMHRLVQTAQELQAPLEDSVPPLVHELGQAALGILRSAKRVQRPNGLHVIAVSAYAANEERVLVDWVKEHDLEYLQLFGKYGSVDYVPFLQSLTVVMQGHEQTPAATTNVTRTAREQLPSPLLIPARDIVLAVAA